MENSKLFCSPFKQCLMVKFCHTTWCSYDFWFFILFHNREANFALFQHCFCFGNFGINCITSPTRIASYSIYWKILDPLSVSTASSSLLLHMQINEQRWTSLTNCTHEASSPYMHYQLSTWEHGRDHLPNDCNFSKHPLGSILNFLHEDHFLLSLMSS